MAYYTLVESHIRYGFTIWGSSLGNRKRVPALYIYEAILYTDTLNLQTHMDLHSYPTCHASRFVLPQHRTALFEKKMSYVGQKLKKPPSRPPPEPDWQQIEELA
ncbi:hypothetical protein J6590_049685 [Homalodisca vitripennis]|nr:hypothetical protein J6590_049685 [Homalodisca vitripennis]